MTAVLRFPTPDDEPIARPEQPAPVSWMDFRVSHPKLWVDNRGGEGSPADWANLLRLKGEPAMSAAYDQLLAAGAKRVFFEKILEAIIDAPLRERKAVEAFLRIPSLSGNRLADLAAADGVSDKIKDIAAWVMTRADILAKMRERKMI